MRKIIIIALVLISTFSLASCASDGPKTKNADPDATIADVISEEKLTDERLKDYNTRMDGVFLDDALFINNESFTKFSYSANANSVTISNQCEEIRGSIDSIQNNQLVLDISPAKFKCGGNDWIGIAKKAVITDNEVILYNDANEELQKLSKQNFDAP